MYPEWFDRTEQDKVRNRHFRSGIVDIPALWKPMQEDTHHNLEDPQTGFRITPTDRIVMAALAGKQKKGFATCI